MIEGATISLRALEPDDVELLYEWENDTSFWSTGDTHAPISINDIKSLIEHSDLDIYQTRQMRLMIVENKSQATIGCIDMFDFEPFNMHTAIGILIDKKHRQQGFAKDAISVFCDYLFNYLNLETILATVSADNIASLALFNSCGFQHNGTYKNWTKRGNKFLDVEIFQKLKK